jgi:tetratricopeptide (TPR) repeat protein
VENLRERFRAARELQEAGDVDRAVQLYEEILDQEPTHAPSLHALGALLNRRQEFARAVSLLERAVVLRPGEPAWHVDLGEGYRNMGLYRDAVGCCATGLKLRPEYPEGWNTLGLALRGAGDLEGALGHFLQSISCREDFYPAHANAATALQELGRPDQAIPHLSRAAELAPEPGPARTQLGLALLSAGRIEDARAEFEAAVRYLADSAPAHHNLGNALRLLGRAQEARACYLRAIRIDHRSALSHLHVGMTLRLEGSLDDALKWHKIAVEMEPDNPEFLAELADLHQKRDEPDEAILRRRRVLELSQADPTDALIDLGWAFQEDGRPEEALEQYRIALCGRPDSAQVHFALGGVHEELGDMAAAEAALREAIRLKPRFPVAYARLATLLRGRLPEGDLRVVGELLSDPRLGRQPRERLLFAMAHVLDARKDYRRAAACLGEANASTLESRRPEGVIYRPEEHEKFVGRLIEAFDADFLRRTAGMGLGTRRPVFIVGLPRSGTTLVEHVLSSHPRVHGAGERLFARRTFEKLPAVVRRGEASIDCVRSLDEYALKRLAGEHLGKLNALDSGRFDRIVDKLPDNYLYLGLLVALFPNATFVHCRRDLRDVAVSCWMTDFRSVRWANDLEHIGSRFLQYRRLMEHWKGVLPVGLHHVDYEETVADLEGVTRRLLDGCGLEWDPACLDFNRTQRTVRTASLTQVRRPIYTSSVERWRNYEADLGELFAILPEVPPKFSDGITRPHATEPTPDDGHRPR